MNKPSHQFYDVAAILVFNNKYISCIYVSVNSNWVHAPGQPPGISSKNLPMGQHLTFESCPGAGNSTKAGILWKMKLKLQKIAWIKFLWRAISSKILSSFLQYFIYFFDALYFYKTIFYFMILLKFLKYFMSWYLFTFSNTQFYRIKGGGGSGRPPTDNFWTVNFTPTNYISLEREFHSE